MLFRLIWVKVRAWVIGLTLTAVAVGILIYSQLPSTATLAVSLIGVHHLGTDFNIPQFYVDKGAYGVISTSGHGGNNCCVMLPKKWRPGLSVDVRWEVDDWSKGRVPGSDKIDFEKVVLVGLYRAQVPVEKYESAEDLFIHILPGGKARVVSSRYFPDSSKHPIQRNDLSAMGSAAAGIRIGEILSKSERVYLKKKRDEERQKHGDWR